MRIARRFLAVGSLALPVGAMLVACGQGLPGQGVGTDSPGRKAEIGDDAMPEGFVLRHPVGNIQQQNCPGGPGAGDPRGSEDSDNREACPAVGG